MRERKGQIMECDFCENLALVVVQNGNIEQVACYSCTYKDILTGWEIVAEMDISPLDYAG
jgi:hypothetical protein